jgi:hypothetical protein
MLNDLHEYCLEHASISERVQVVSLFEHIPPRYRIAEKPDCSLYIGNPVTLEEETMSTEKVERLSISFKNIHEFIHSSLEKREVMVILPKESFSIIN